MYRFLNTKPLLLIARFVTLASLLSACASPRAVVDEYRDSASENLGPSAHTSIVFLVDGLSVPILKNALHDGLTPRIEDFFSLPRFKNGEFPLGRASFPTLTYPNLVSILTGYPVALHGINGNHVFDASGTDTNFEDVLNWPYLHERVDKQTVFYHLARRRELSLSFSYPFAHEATASQSRSIDVGVSYVRKNYDAIDAKTLDSLTHFLDSVPFREWPRFIFVHLIGVDGLAHELGPNDPKIGEALADLDSRLAPVFENLKRAERDGLLVTAALTADHGFTATNSTVSFARITDRLPEGARVLADNRIASVFLSPGARPEAKINAARELATVPHVAWAIVSVDGHLELEHASGRRARIDFRPANCRYTNSAARFEWTKGRMASDELAPAYRCPEDYDRLASFESASFLVPALTEYFRAAKAPDLVLIADGRSDFIGGYKGNHGGLTPEEALVPLLTRNVKRSADVIPTWRLLRLLRLD